MKIEVIPNDGSMNLEAELRASLSWAEQVDIASAFVTAPALRLLERAMVQAQQAERCINTRLIFGLYQRFTPPEAIDKAIHLQRAYPDMFSVRIARNDRFHWKLYIFAKGAERRVYIGSANFTEDGLTLPGELSVKIAGKASDSIFKSLQGEFDKLWETDEETFEGTLSPDATWLDRYQELKRPQTVSTLQKDKEALGLHTPPKKRKQTATIRPPLIRLLPRLSPSKLLEARRRKLIIQDQTDWYEKKDWRSFSYSSEHRRNARQEAKIIVAWSKSEVQLLKVEATADIETPGGKNYHLAYSIIKSVEYSEVKEELEKIELTKENASANKCLTQRQFRELCRLMDVNIEDILQEE